MVRVPLMLVAFVASVALGESAEHAVDVEALAVDVEEEELACHGPAQEPTHTHAEACARAQQASELGDPMGLYWMVEIMREHDPSEAKPCTTRFDVAMASIHPRQREDYRAGLVAMKAGELDRARSCFRLALAKDPNNQVAARRLGEVEAAMKPPEAESTEPAAQPETAGE